MVRVWCCFVEAISGIVLKFDNGVDDAVVACGCFVVVDSDVACIVSWVDVVGTREDVVALDIDFEWEKGGDCLIRVVAETDVCAYTNDMLLWCIVNC